MPKQALKAARGELRRGSRELAFDARRNAGNARASFRVLVLSALVAALISSPRYDSPRTHAKPICGSSDCFPLSTSPPPGSTATTDCVPSAATT